MPFEEILYQAEMDRHIYPDAEKEAFMLCGEDPTTKALKIQELRNLIYSRGECRPHRLDDDYLLRFLRARHFIPARAHRLMVRYCTFREQNPHLWRDVDWFGLRKLGNMFEGVLYDRPDVGRIIICRMGEWDPNVLPIEDMLRGGLLLLEIGIMQPKLQILGGSTIVDCEGISMKHIRQFSPAVAMQGMNIMGLSFPLHLRGIHIVNCSRLVDTLFHFFRKLMPGDEIWKMVHFHGYNMNSLHGYIDPECLPKRYGGRKDPISLRDWLTKIQQYSNKDFHDEMRNLGYAD